MKLSIEGTSGEIKEILSAIVIAERLTINQYR